LRLFIDECLSPQLALRLNRTGRHGTIHPLHVGRRGQSDRVVLARCIAEGRVIVTENGEDFRELAAGADIHPGIVILPCLEREQTWELLQAAIAHIERLGDPMAAMVNMALEIDEAGRIEMYPLPR
jgi:predicted nuclease of predicted toxin-antitoxin system